MRISILGISFLIFLLNVESRESFRIWTNLDGRTIEARFLELVDTKVRFEVKSGRIFTLPLSSFSHADQLYVLEADERSLFIYPASFEENGKGAVIVASLAGEVSVLFPQKDYYSNLNPKKRPVILGESFSNGTILITGSNSKAGLLLTNGTIVHLEENSKLLVSALYQKKFTGSKRIVTEIKNETSPSKTALKLEYGELIVDVRKLNKKSSFLIETNSGNAGIRGTQFRISTDDDTSILAVLEGAVSFMDHTGEIFPVNSDQKTKSSRNKKTSLVGMDMTEKSSIQKKIAESKNSLKRIDLNDLANTVDGFSQKPIFNLRTIDMEMIWCPPGGFIMGPGDDAEQQPAHPVVLSKGFYLGKFEVTQEQFQKVTGENPSEFKGKKNPVEQINWKEAREFCKILSKRERLKRGWAFVLPTEAEWEYAFKGQLPTKLFKNSLYKPNVANINSSGIKRTTEVGKYKPNSFGFYDMAGNVWEMCSDRFTNEYSKLPVKDPKGATHQGRVVLRGGSWVHFGAHSKSLWRAATSEDYKHSCIGFRVALKQIL